MATEKKVEKTDRSFLKTGKPPAAKGLKKSTPLGGQAGEICYGCGTEIPAKAHPDLPPTSVIGIMNAKDVDDGWTVIDNPSTAAAEDGESYVGVPVCLACHKDPQHRTAHPLKVHFFERIGGTPKMALIMAGSMGIQG